ncbi:MAG: hypothetical protein ACK5OB_13195 [Pirellula sp.]
MPEIKSRSSDEGTALQAGTRSSELSRLTPGRVAALVGVALLVMITNVAASILYMVFYGHVLDPGHEPQYYQDHIQVAGPYCSIVAGIPILFLAGWWVAGWWQRSLGYRGVFFVWLVYTLIDVSILLIAGMSLGMGTLFIVSFATKLAAGYCGASARLRQPIRSSDSR